MAKAVALHAGQGDVEKGFGRHRDHGRLIDRDGPRQRRPPRAIAVSTSRSVNMPLDAAGLAVERDERADAPGASANRRSSWYREKGDDGVVITSETRWR
jgi:hypothetical protein